MTSGFYFKGLRTPDGPMVAFQHPGADAVSYGPWNQLDWDTPTGRSYLAHALLLDTGHSYAPEEVRTEFLERFFPCEPGDRWVITAHEINDWYNSHPEWVERDKNPVLF